MKLPEYHAISSVAEEILGHLGRLCHRDRLPHIRLDRIGGILSHPVLSGTDLASLIQQSGYLRVELLPENQRNVRGGYWRGGIRLYCKEAFLSRLRSAAPKERSVMLREYFLPVLVHELRHAVDAHRLGDILCGGKRVFRGVYPEGSKAHRFVELHHRKPCPLLEPVAWERYRRAYLNLPHEVWARFSEWVCCSGRLSARVPLADVMRSIGAIPGFCAMVERTRRRLRRSACALWHQAKEETT